MDTPVKSQVAEISVPPPFTDSPVQAISDSENFSIVRAALDSKSEPVTVTAAELSSSTLIGVYPDTVASATYVTDNLGTEDPLSNENISTVLAVTGSPPLIPILNPVYPVLDIDVGLVRLIGDEILPKS